MTIKGVGIDIVEIKRFRKINSRIKDKFIVSNFSKEERSYVFSHKDWALHLAGIFAAKESVIKALGKNNISMSSIEIRKTARGKPTVFVKGRKRKDILTTISHSNNIAISLSLIL